MRETLQELAEEPGLWAVPEPVNARIGCDGYTFVTWGRRASVERIRLGDVERAVSEARSLAGARGLREVTWWTGERSTPESLVDRLLALGLVPDASVPELTSLTISRRPDGDPAVEVRRVHGDEDYLRALELDWEVWNVPPEVREERRATAGAHWARVEADGRTALYLAYLDGAPAGFGRVVFAPQAGILFGGSTLPSARGRGVYSSLVHARWDEAVERGVPRLTVSAGAMSAPILERLGFETIGRIRLLTDPLGPDASRTG